VFGKDLKNTALKLLRNNPDKLPTKRGSEIAGQ
jgi:hypothetical protein